MIDKKYQTKIKLNLVGQSNKIIQKGVTSNKNFPFNNPGESINFFQVSSSYNKDYDYSFY